MVAFCVVSLLPGIISINHICIYAYVMNTKGPQRKQKRELEFSRGRVGCNRDETVEISTEYN